MRLTERCCATPPPPKRAGAFRPSSASSTFICSVTKRMPSEGLPQVRVNTSNSCGRHNLNLYQDGGSGCGGFFVRNHEGSRMRTREEITKEVEERTEFRVESPSDKIIGQSN